MFLKDIQVFVHPRKGLRGAPVLAPTEACSPVPEAADSFLLLGCECTCLPDSGLVVGCWQKLQLVKPRHLPTGEGRCGLSHRKSCLEWEADPPELGPQQLGGQNQEGAGLAKSRAGGGGREDRAGSRSTARRVPSSHPASGPLCSSACGPLIPGSCRVQPM